MAYFIDGRIYRVRFQICSEFLLRGDTEPIGNFLLGFCFYFAVADDKH